MDGTYITRVQDPCNEVSAMLSNISYLCLLRGALERWVTHAGSERLLLFRARRRPRRVHRGRSYAARAEIDSEPSHAGTRKRSGRAAAQSNLPSIRVDGRGRGFLSARGGDASRGGARRDDDPPS